ncbi:hypothetical protein E1295_03060 [Nonomuraea mesophila]|uniref:Uncharacterized protein n=1 Tax=Nonomuraea mesophila TaxID=2530382 RepID=A0A4R5FXF8_9ACTN|nr:hypothetical protein [Nonomuraea mesophila]TDE59227.1 hypothetical protein E1295_03060 [Nonomuraea mesophila]
MRRLLPGGVCRLHNDQDPPPGEPAARTGHTTFCAGHSQNERPSRAVAPPADEQLGQDDEQLGQYIEHAEQALTTMRKH